MNVTSLVCKTRGLGICDLPADVLILMLSPLHGQDIARCKTVCRHFSTLIRSDISLQYKIELVQNGMIDGQSSTLPISERLQRLREYASRFRNGNFDHEDLMAHEEYANSFLSDPTWTFLEVSSHENSLSTLYTRGPHDSPLRKPHRLVLSAFTPGSAQAGIQSSRCLLPIDGPHPGPEAEACPRWIYKWAIDGAQDLLVMAEGKQNIDMPEHLDRWLEEFRISFCSFSTSMTAGPTPHPDAMLSTVRIFAGRAVMQNDVLSRVTIFDLHIAGEYVIWVLVATRGKLQNVSVEVCDWKKGEVISRIDVGTEPVKVIPLGYPYFLVIPKPPQMYSHIEGYRKAIDIYSFSPSFTPSPRVICTLQLPSEHLEPGEYIAFQGIRTGDRPQTSSGHFLPDLSRSTLVLTFSIHGPRGERETHYLIPRATLLAQIHAAESQMQQTHDSGPVSVPVPVPWAYWGPQGCLRLALQPPMSGHCAMPFGSRFPLFVLDESDARNAAVYVFDVDPLVVRSQKQIAAARRRDSSTSTSLQEPAGETTGMATTTAGTVVEDIQAVLPGVVDPECSSIPYVVHRFQLSCADKEWRFIETVAMGMTGFTIRVLRFDLQKEQTWSV